MAGMFPLLLMMVLNPDSSSSIMDSAPDGIISVGDLQFRVVSQAAGVRRYIHLHGDETTAREVLKNHVAHYSGFAFFVLGDQRTGPINGGEVDPNRMFSDSGARENIQSQNPHWTSKQIEQAVDILRRDRTRLLDPLLPPPGGLIIAVHNNGPDYSVNDEIPISDQVSINDPEAPDDFFLCTDPSDFKVLSESSYNVVLQIKAPTEDDGSLSRLAASRGIRYVNIEVALGKTTKQTEMLLWLEKTLP